MTENKSKENKWTKETIVAQLQQWRGEGIEAKSLWRQDRRLTSRGASLFGSWRNALAAAGIESARQRWTRQLVIEQLKTTRGRGLPVDSPLKAAATRYFGTLRNACHVAGVKCETANPPDQEWDGSKVLAEIQKRVDNGQSLRATSREDPALYSAAKRIYKTWSNACREAGHPRETITRLSANEVIARISSHHARNAPLPKLREQDRVLFYSAKRQFGSWTEALVAAGIKSRCPQRWDRQKVLTAIQKRHTAGHALNRTWREDKPLFRAAVTHWGGWRAAVKAAGFKPTKGERWSKQRVIERLQAWSERSQDTYLQRSDQALLGAAIRFFGSQDAAFEAAGIPVASRRWTQSRIVEAIQDRYIAGGSHDRAGFGDSKLANAAKRHFGSWRDAVEAAGLAERVPIPTPIPRKTPDEVIAEIRQWHDAGRRFGEVHRTNVPLLNAARMHFKTWNKAILAANLKPDCPRYTKPQILGMIRQRQDAGLSLSSGHPDVRNLAMLTCRHFGTWRKGLKAAGVGSSNCSRRTPS